MISDLQPGHVDIDEQVVAIFDADGLVPDLVNRHSVLFGDELRCPVGDQAHAALGLIEQDDVWKVFHVVLLVTLSKYGYPYLNR